MLDVKDVVNHTYHWESTDGHFKSMKGAVIKEITDLYQRRYKTWSLYIFVFLYIIRDTTMLVDGGNVK